LAQSDEASDRGYGSQKVYVPGIEPPESPLPEEEHAEANASVPAPVRVRRRYLTVTSLGMRGRGGQEVGSQMRILPMVRLPHA
jgi:hypothetical protein